METIVKPCSCIHEYQDETYGKGMRVFNVRMGGKPPRCTVCEKEYHSNQVRGK